MIRFYNGRVLEGSSVTENEVWIEGAAIRYVGPAREELPEFERQIDLKGNLLMPGFKNAHTHSAMTFLRSMADDLPLQKWLFEQVFPREAHLTAERVVAFSKVAFLEYIANGITACFDMYYHQKELAELADRWGFRLSICEAMSARNDWSEYYANNEAFADMSPFVRYNLGFHAEYTASDEMLRYLSRVCHELKKPVWTHNSETRLEVEQCVERHGVTPTRYMEELGLFEYGGGGYHCVHLSDEDIEIFRKRGLYAVLNPASNAKLASGIPPLRRLLDSGIHLAMGTDGPASNNALDMFREMYLINVMAKLDEKDAAAGDPARILEAAVSGGARAMGFPECDGIADGKQADLIVIDLNRPNMRPIHNVVKNLVYSGNPGNVLMTMIAGRILYENGEFHVGEDPGTVFLEAERMTRELIEEAS